MKGNHTMLRIRRPRKSITMTTQMQQYNSPTTGRHDMSHPNVPLSSIAGEIGTTADALAVKFADAVVIDDDTGLRFVSAKLARQFLTDHRAALQAGRDRENARREAARRQPHPVRDHVRAVQASQRPFNGTDAPALGRITAADHADRPLDERLYPANTPMPYHRIQEG